MELLRKYPIVAAALVVLTLLAGLFLYRFVPHDTLEVYEKRATSVPLTKSRPSQTTPERPSKPMPDPSRVTIYICGAVKKAGVYALPKGSRILHALKTAGGASQEADLEAINLAHTLEDEEMVVVPRKGENKAPPRTRKRRRGAHTRRVSGSPKRTTHRTGSAKAPKPYQSGKVNINTAGLDQLIALPGIGPTLAHRIIEYRKENGPFASVEDLVQVDGIGPKTLGKFRDLVKI
ncbi:MAG: helix-hairpin-helix domain-containing protein [Armatimonadetes bacterium]|nr:helix-hairpin-helix domain-containing protein [Armatimonadota bacterium]